MIYVIATVNLKPGTVEDFVAAAAPCLIGTRAEEGCISYDLHRREGEPNTLVFVERWESREHLKAHFSAPHMLVYREATKDMVANRTIEIIEPAKVDNL
ncbi:putative quinol monooxygenase [Rhizobium sp. C4]|uniref:putative quinol monooxygenase n=1 Tax=Rhizobium sp. C4 TaxID=1349800 RepID=UPI001E2BE9F5|nr:putative quinol monooxygenase [Rhizobium sp. C4]MCD2173800.1 antibiotic biosynthesis monooxygenase [Rhizobium sp. C4]